MTPTDQLYPFPAVLGGDPDAPGGLDDMALALFSASCIPASAACWCAARRAPRSRRWCAHSPRYCRPSTSSPVIGSLPTPPSRTRSHRTARSDPTRPWKPGRCDWWSFPSAPPKTGWPVRSISNRRSSEGAVHFEPGLLARAHRGILYVDEVNLLHDHLVDLLLDAAAMGTVTVERDGISVTHSAKFVLVGTMNPEEGELRPQLLDRFGLTVEVAAPRDPASAGRGSAPTAVVRRGPACVPSPVRGMPNSGFAFGFSRPSRSCPESNSPPRRCSASPKSARRSASTACGPTSSWRGPPPRTPHGTAVRSRTSMICAPPRGSRCRIAAGAIHSTLPASTRTNSTSCCLRTTGDGPDPDTDPDGPDGGHDDGDPGDPPPSGNGGQPNHTSAPADSEPVGAGEPYKTQPFHRSAGWGTGMPVAAAAPGRRPVAAPAQPAVEYRFRHSFRRDRANCRTASGRSRPQRRPAAVCCPLTCVGPSARDAKPTWCSSSSTPRDPWLPASGCIRSRRPSCRCCSTPTGGATGSA